MDSGSECEGAGGWEVSNETNVVALVPFEHRALDAEQAKAGVG